MSPKEKTEASSLQLELEERLNNFDKFLTASLDKYVQLERDLVRVKKKLQKSLKWATSSKILNNLTNQRSNGGKGLGKTNVSPPYHTQNKYVFLSDNILIHLLW